MSRQSLPSLRLGALGSLVTERSPVWALRRPHDDGPVERRVSLSMPAAVEAVAARRMGQAPQSLAKAASA